ncbi:radical SAM protein [Archaeoglobus sp.]|uniref:B12-binding domain-containing radical SAM protein n=1 Tax=Archaeoglobus sp. TaxID=1872626 RepID=UPI0024AC5DA1|nr:radical SAM protein [Archaeoglobus sp.]MDI3498486.1 hypothetical protein [Archaeoglobus sp.]
MTRIILTADESLTSNYRNVPLLDFLGCAPYDKLPKWVFRILDTQLPERDGLLLQAPYGLRKVESALLRDGFSREEVAVVHPRKIEMFINTDTRIVALYEMDPFGLGPVTMMFTNGGEWQSYTKVKFLELVNRINRLRVKNGFDFKLVVGGPGAWQIDFWKDERERLKIDHVVIGEIDHIAGEIFRKIENGEAEETIVVKSSPGIEEIPAIVAPTYKGIVEVTRGCGRGCRFCEPNLRTARHIPIEKIEEEIKVNISAGINRVWLHSEDIFLYQVEDKKNFYPNANAVIELFSMAGVYTENVNPTHGSVSGALAIPGMIEEISSIVNASPRHWIGIQVGLETASPELISKYMKNKARPFSPEEWPWVVLNGTYVFNKNYWFPAYTTILGLPDESEEDGIITAQLIVTMEKELERKLGKQAHFTVTPLAFIPLGLLKDREFYRVEEMINYGQFLHLYYAWKHMQKEIAKGLPAVMRNNLFLIPFLPLARLGSRILLKQIEKWGENRGYKLRRLEPLNIRIEDYSQNFTSSHELAEVY